MIAFAFILWHVFQMHGWFRWEWWHASRRPAVGRGPLRSQGCRGHGRGRFAKFAGLIGIAYVVGVLACVYHLANGLWTMGITWGVWTSPAPSAGPIIPCAGFGVVLAISAVVALWGTLTFPVPARPARVPGPAAAAAVRRAGANSPRRPGFRPRGSQAHQGAM